MFETLKEFFTANYDANTDQIKGCREHSLAWFHEDRHRKQMTSKLLRTIWMWIPTYTGIAGLIMVWLLIIMPSQVILILGGYALMPLTFFFLFLEVDANLYSFYKKIKYEYNGYLVNKYGR